MKTEDLIEHLKKNTKKVNVKINGKNIDLPIHYNLVATESYIDNFENTKDCKEAFRAMLLDSIGISDEEDIKNINTEDIKTISDEDLVRIGIIIIKQSKDLDSNYTNQKEKSFYENFNKAILKEYEKYKIEIKKVTDTMIEPFERMRNSIELVSKGISSIVENNMPIQPISDENISNNKYKTGIDVFKDLKPIKNPTNILLEEQIEANKSIAKILLENQKENRIANEESTKLNRNNFYIMVATLIATIIGIIITGVGVWITIKGNS
jgi:hypothetical protein